MNVPNIDKPRPGGAKWIRETVANGRPSDLLLDDEPRYSVNGKVRIAVAIEWRPEGTGMLVRVWRSGGFALFPYVRWKDNSGRSGLMPYSDFRRLGVVGT